MGAARAQRNKVTCAWRQLYAGLKCEALGLAWACTLSSLNQAAVPLLLARLICMHLWLKVKRTKEMLSANTAAPVSVEEIMDGIDFRSSITR